MTKQKLTILVDMDDVLENLVECWIAELNLRFGTAVSVDDVTTWNIAEVFPSLTPKQVFSPLYDTDFWAKLSALPGAQEYLKRLIDDGHKIRIVTASYYETLPAKMELLFREFPFLNWNDVIVAHDKKLIRGDVLIDDAIHNLEDAPYNKLLFHRPYNKDYDAAANGMIRVYNWCDIYREIEKMIGVV